MNTRAGLWIDHRQAIVVHISADKVTTETIPSNVEKHVSTSRGSRSATPWGPEDAVAEDRIDRKYQQHLEGYYEQVTQTLRGVEALLVMGPGEAKTEFRKHLLKHGHKPLPAIEMETTDKMTPARVTARVKQHFSVESR